MKNILLFLLVFAIYIPVNAQYKMALGARFSTGDAIVNHSISFKYFITPTVSGEALFSFGDPFAVGLLFAKHKPITDNNFTFFYGGGAYFGASSAYRGGLQGVLGLDHKLADLPLNLSIDWKPELNLSREFTFEPAALGLTARFVFK